MRRSHIWLVLALAWGLDCVLASVRRNWVQTWLTALFAGCFLVIGLLFRRKERRRRDDSSRVLPGRET